MKVTPRARASVDDVILPCMTQWQSKYSSAQRAAIVRAFCDLRIRPVTDIARMAAAGELTPAADAEPLPAFEIPANTARDIGVRAERRKRGDELRPELRNLPARDRAHALQLRLTALIDVEIQRLEDQQKAARKPLDPKQLQGIARLLRELATLPDPSEPRVPAVPGQREADGTQRGATRSGLGASIIAAADASTSPSTRTKQASTSTTPTGDTTTPTDSAATTPQHDNDSDDDHDDDSAPCSPPHDRVAPAMS